MDGMTFFTGSLRQAALAVCARDGVEVAGLASGDLLRLSADVARVRRVSDVMLAELASEIGRRSDNAEVGAGLATQQGYRSAGELFAQAMGGSVAEAKRLAGVGNLLADADRSDVARFGSPSGEARDAEVEPTPLEQVRLDLAVAVREGRLSVDAAALFTEALMRVPDGERTRHLFVKALTKAEGLALHQVRKLVWQAQAFSDPGAWEVRENRQHEARTLSIRDDTDGMVTLAARLTPLAAAPVRAVLDAGVRWAMQQRRDDPESDTRTPCQMRADLLTNLCRHALDCTQATTGVKTTVVVRMTLADLQSGCGVGKIDGTPQPVSVSALRQAAADAEVIPAVLGGESDVLDWGRARRLFTPAQRLALVERDGGCAWCNAPPSWCEAHHIRWWTRDAGPTNMSNAVLLCARCHHRIHRDGWDVDVLHHTVRFIPPPSIDPLRTPRLGARQRYHLIA
jgi:hypothetical protein